MAAEHLASMPSGAQPPLARQLLEMIAKLPFASDRCNAFAKVRAVLLRTHDLALIRVGHGALGATNLRQYSSAMP